MTDLKSVAVLPSEATNPYTAPRAWNSALTCSSTIFSNVMMPQMNIQFGFSASRVIRHTKTVCLGYGILFMAGCAGTLNQSFPVSSPANVVRSQEERVIVVTPPAVSSRETSIQNLLKQADRAFAQGRLTLPEHDNAYDRYRAVQMMDPENKWAKAGLDSILVMYNERIRQSLAAGRLGAAQSELRQAKLYFPKNALLEIVEKEVRQRVQAQQSASPESSTAGHQKIVLSPTELNAKSEKIQKQLVDIALRVKDSDETVMIYARNDGEGRWIYKTMKDAVGDYRIRGDIRINRQPSIELLSPME